MAIVDGSKFRLLLNTLAEYMKVDTLATPHILTQSNKEARICSIGRSVR
jgi:type II secretory pathway component GspD/PulD (secretin)